MFAAIRYDVSWDFFHTTVKGRVVCRSHNQWIHILDTYIITLVFLWYMLGYVEATFSLMYLNNTLSLWLPNGHYVILCKYGG